MGKKGLNKKGPTSTSGPQMSVTIREASTGKKHTNVKTSLKLQHIKNLAMWATRDASIPSLGAFFGHHLAASSEALGLPVDRSLFTCQRCESILHPGNNCTMRIEKIKKRSRHKGKQATTQPQNYTVYTCHFCSHRNMKRGTPRNTSQPMAEPHPNSTKQETGNTVSSDTTKDNISANTRATPLVPTTDDPRMSKMDIVEIKETLKVNDNSVDINAPDRRKMGIVEINETLKVKDDSVDINAPGRREMGIVEINEPLKVKDNSVEINTPDNTVSSFDTTKDNIAANTRATPLAPTIDDPHRDKMSIVKTVETSKVKDDSVDINTPDKSKMDTLDITDTLEVKKGSDAFGPATPLTRPTLTLLESKSKKRNRAGPKKKGAPESTPITEISSKRKRRKSWTTLKEIAESNEKEKRMKLMNLTIPFSMQ